MSFHTLQLDVPDLLVSTRKCGPLAHPIEQLTDQTQRVDLIVISGEQSEIEPLLTFQPSGEHDERS